MKSEISRAVFLKGTALALAGAAIPAGNKALAATTFAHGVYTDQIFKATWDNLDMRPAIDAAQTANGKKPTIVKFYGAWAAKWGLSGFPRNHLEAIEARGCQPLFTWQPEYSYASPSEEAAFTPYRIARGSQDTLIRSFAEEAKKWGKTIWLRIFHEADLRNHGQYIWQEGSTADVVAAYRRTVRIFRDVGASNVRWVWNVGNATSYSRIRAVWPGGDYADFVGTDTYGNPEWNGNQWKSFYSIFAPQYRNLGYLTSKPIIIGELGQVEGNPGWKGEWIRKAHVEDIPRFPRVRAACYFDSWGWVLNSSASAREGYRRALADTRWQGRV